MEYQKLPTRTDCYTTISTADQVRCRYRIVVYCITRRRGTRAPEIARYLQLLQAELEDEDSDQTEGGR